MFVKPIGVFIRSPTRLHAAVRRCRLFGQSDRLRSCCWTGRTHTSSDPAVRLARPGRHCTCALTKTSRERLVGQAARLVELLDLLGLMARVEHLTTDRRRTE